MTAFRHFLYPAPDGPKTMVAVEDILRVDGDTPFAWWRIDASVVQVKSLTTAIYLRCAFPYRPIDIGGDALLDDYEVWVDDEDKQECERMLKENCAPSSSARFLDLIEVEFADDDEHRRFGAVYTAITGLPNAFSPKPNPAAMEAAGTPGPRS
jgi:hypothetical protein